MSNLTLPTKEESSNIEKILVTTSFIKEGYVANATVDGEDWATKPKDAPYTAIKHLIDAIAAEKLTKGQKRDQDYIFVTKAKVG